MVSSQIWEGPAGFIALSPKLAIGGFNFQVPPWLMRGLTPRPGCVYRFGGYRWKKRRARASPSPSRRIATGRGARVARLRCPILRAGKEILADAWKNGKRKLPREAQGITRDNYTGVFSLPVAPKAINATWRPGGRLEVESANYNKEGRQNFLPTSPPASGPASALGSRPRVALSSAQARR